MKGDSLLVLKNHKEAIINSYLVTHGSFLDVASANIFGHHFEGEELARLKSRVESIIALRSQKEVAKIRRLKRFLEANEISLDEFMEYEDSRIDWDRYWGDD